MRGLVMFLVLTLLAGIGGATAAPPAAPAASPSPTERKARIEHLADTAAQHYAAGRFREAIAAYQEAYEIEPFGPLLYNIAYIFDRELDDPALAQDYYRRYVNAPDAEAETRVTAFERLQVIEARLRVAPAPAPPPTVVHTGASTQTVIGWTVLGIGVATAGAGVAFALAAQSTHDDFEHTDDALRRDQLRDDGRRQALIGDVALSVGGVAIVSGVVLLLTGGHPDVAPAVSVSPDGKASVAWRW